MKYIIVNGTSKIGEIELDDKVEPQDFILIDEALRKVIQVHRLVGHSDYQVISVSGYYAHSES
jgi:hypothetical protein